MKRLEATLGLVAAVALFAMMALTFADVIGRKLLGASIPGSLEVTELLMLAVIFVALPLTSLHGEHVVFDLLESLLPARLLTWQHRIANLVCLALLLGGAWLVTLRAGRTLEGGDVTAQLGLPLAPFHYAVALLLLLTAAMHLVLAARATPRSDAFHVPAVESKDD
jgi:TRAP-type C4-dicarboxylate transport system permease small subunit